VDLGRWLNAGWYIIKDDILSFALATLLLGLLGSITCGVLAPALSCGLFMMAFQKMAYGRVDVSMVFAGFQRFLPAFLTGLALFGLLLAATCISMGPLFLVQAAAPDNQAALALAQLWNYPVSIVLQSLIYAAFFFVFPHIAARNVAAAEAITASWEVFRRNVLMFALTAFLFQLISGLGALACCIGVLVTQPLVMAATAQAYADHFGIAGLEAL
jgi:uncharacterized membrane protein